MVLSQSCDWLRKERVSGREGVIQGFWMLELGRMAGRRVSSLLQNLAILSSRHSNQTSAARVLASSLPPASVGSSIMTQQNTGTQGCSGMFHMLKDAIHISLCVSASGLCETSFFNVHSMLFWLVMQVWVATHSELTTDLGKTITGHQEEH